MKCSIFLGILLIVSFNIFGQSAAGPISDCTYYPPKNGAVACNSFSSDIGCTPSCSPGFKFESDPAVIYMCTAGKWITYPGDKSFPWPDCISTSA